VNSDRGLAPRSGASSDAQKNAHHITIFARVFRTATAVLAATAAFTLLFTTTTFADYADGGRTEQAMTLPDAVKVWRQEAWQRDDFLAQVRLGDLYSTSQSIAPGETKNAAFVDPVEAYVWYFMALRPGRDYRADDNMGASDTVYGVRNGALNSAEQIYNSLTFEQRLDARARILYILSSRGGEGFLTLGRIHASGWQDSGYHGGPNSLPPLKVRLCLRSSWDHWWSGWLWWIWSSLTANPYPHPPVWRWVDNVPENWKRRLPDYQCFGAENPPAPLDLYGAPSSSATPPMPTTSSGSDSPALIAPPVPGSTAPAASSDAMPTVNPGNSYGGSSDPAYATGSAPSGYSAYGSNSSYGASSSYGGYGSYGSSSYGGYYGGRSVSSVFVTNDAEALTYFLIAQRLGHPLAGAYVTNERSAIRYNNVDPGRIIADAEKRARFWNAPYEYYPGVTAKGELHSDESLPSFEQRMALRRVREIPITAIVEALDFRGYRMNPRLCGPPPVCMGRAVSQFQTALNWEPNGFLNPLQTVRLIQMAAVDGDAIAQDRLGIMYAKGIGVPQNFVKAERWFIKAANQRYPDALFNLSVLYRVGPNGVEPDEHKSTSYRAQADAAGYPMARCELLDLLKMADAHDRPEGAKR
jgi:TPR repeat protein